MNKRRECGFTLIEVLVAFAIAAISVVALVQALGNNLNRTALVEEYTTANRFARSMLARIGRDIPVVPGRTGGRFDQTYRWSRTVRPRPTPARGPLLPYEVELTVSWRSGRADRSITLHTLRLAGA